MLQISDGREEAAHFVNDTTQQLELWEASEPTTHLKADAQWISKLQAEQTRREALWPQIDDLVAKWSHLATADAQAAMLGQNAHLKDQWRMLHAKLAKWHECVEVCTYRRMAHAHTV